MFKHKVVGEYRDVAAVQSVYWPSSQTEPFVHHVEFPCSFPPLSNRSHLRKDDSPASPILNLHHQPGARDKIIDYNPPITSRHPSLPLPSPPSGPFPSPFALAQQQAGPQKRVASNPATQQQRQQNPQGATLAPHRLCVLSVERDANRNASRENEG